MHARSAPRWAGEPGVAIRWRARALALVVAVAALVNALKCAATGVNHSMWPYWALTYRHGIVRRGLAGTIFQSLVGGVSVGEQEAFVLQLHVAATWLFGALLVAWAERARGELRTDRARALVTTGTAALFLGHLFPTLGLTAGYLDVYVLVLIALGAFLAWRQRYAAAGAIAAVAPLIHDEAVFLWLPILICVGRDVLASSTSTESRRRAFAQRAPLALPIVTTALVLALHSSRAVAASLDDMPAAWREIAVYEMPLSYMAARMLDAHTHNATRFALALLMYLPPAALVISCARALAPHRRTTVPIVAALAPCAILAVAWDLSRFLVWSGFGAFVALAWAAKATDGDEEPQAARLPTPILAGLLALSTMAFGGPSLFSYFDHTFADYRVGPAWLRETPGARLTTAWLRLYNQPYLVTSLSSADGCASSECPDRVRPGTTLETLPVGFEPDHYLATARVRTEPGCEAGSGELAVRLGWRLAPGKSSIPFDVQDEQIVTLPFTIDDEEAAMGRTSLAIIGRAGCFRVESLEASRSGR